LSKLADIALKTNGNQLLLLFAIVAAAALSFYVYRNTIPPVSGLWRALLASLRGLAIILVVLLLFEPILSITREKLEKPVVAVLIDDSASMNLKDEKGGRAQAVREVLANNLFQSPPGDLDVRFFPFSHEIEGEALAPPDSLTFDGDGTNIRSALEALSERLSEQNFVSVVLVSDGGNNLGDSPIRLAKTYGVPIHTVAIGDPTQQTDLLVSNYVTNEIAYSEAEVPVEVYVKGTGFKDRKIPVSLKQNGRTLDTQFVTLTGNSLEQKVQLTFKPEKAGLFKYDIEVPEMAGELTSLNNRKSFYTKVLKNKLRVLLVAGAPGPDLLFLKRALIRTENFQVTTFIEKYRGEFYGPSPVVDTQDYDCAVFIDYPRSASKQRDLDHFKQMFATGKPALFMPGKQTDLDKLMQWQEFLPLAQKPRRVAERSVYLKIPPQGLYHPLLRLSDDYLENEARWQELPPVFTNLVLSTLAHSAKTIIVTDPQRSGLARRGQSPFMTVLDSGSRKSIFLAGYGLWRWDLLMWGVGKNNETYLRFIRNALRWLTTREESKLVRVVSNKEIYRSGEEVEFSAQVYFEDYRPVDGAEVVVQLQSGETQHELTLNGIGDGRYEGTLQILEGGDYEFSGTAHQQGRVIGRDTGKFSVEPFSLEYQNTAMNRDLLQRVAQESGGQYYTADKVDSVRANMSFPRKYVTLTSEWELWNRLPVLALCILILAGEWLLRKRKGML